MPLVLETRNRRVLIVDDNKAIHQDFAKILAPGPRSEIDEFAASVFKRPKGRRKGFAGYELESAYQGGEALERVRAACKEKRPYAMAFVDMRMPPGWDGIETIRRLWQEDPALEIVICTAYAEHSWKEITKALGRPKHLLILKKPFDNIEALQLAAALTEKWDLTRTAKIKRDELEARVEARTAALQKANEQTDQFLAFMSHELRTPMNGMIGFIDLLRKEYYGPINAKQKVFARNMHEYAAKLHGMTDQLLDAIKKDPRERKPGSAAFSCAGLIESVLATLHDRFRDKRIATSLQTEKDLPPIRGDRDYCLEALQCLVSNAAEHTPEGGSVRICVESRDAGTIKISVADNGIGIEQARLEKLFLPKDPTEDQGAPSSPAVDVQLPRARKLVEAQGGSIGVESLPGEGSTFWITLPADTASSARPPIAEAAPREAARAKAKVLVAEDNAVNLSLVKHILSTLDVEVVTAENGQEACELAREHTPDLILMDIQMPVMDGLEAVRKLRAQPRFAATPIVALTAGVDSESIRGCMDAGCTEYLSKPIQSQALAGLVRRYCPPTGGPPGKQSGQPENT